jgi:hypothetical protein
MGNGEGALSPSALGPSDLAVELVQSGGIAGIDMSATVRLADLPAADADRTRELVEQVLSEQPKAAAARGPVFDGMEYELTVSRAGGAARKIVTRDGTLTPAQRELIGVLKPHLSPR